MRLEDIKNILENRLKNLQETRNLAASCGSILQVLTIDDDITTTIITLQQIETILDN